MSNAKRGSSTEARSGSDARLSDSAAENDRTLGTRTARWSTEAPKRPDRKISEGDRPRAHADQRAPPTPRADKQKPRAGDQRGALIFTARPCFVQFERNSASTTSSFFGVAWLPGDAWLPGAAPAPAPGGGGPPAPPCAPAALYISSATLWLVVSSFASAASIAALSVPSRTAPSSLIASSRVLAVSGEIFSLFSLSSFSIW